jgi:hypothetical protein
MVSWKYAASGCKISCKWLASGDIKSHLLIFSPKKLMVVSEEFLNRPSSGLLGFTKEVKNVSKEN